jgi:hypothetical protein
MSGTNKTHFVYWKRFKTPVPGKNDYIGYYNQPAPSGIFYKLGVQNGNEQDSRYNKNKELEGDMSWSELFESHENLKFLGPYTVEDAFYIEEVITELIKTDLQWKGQYLKNFGADKMFNGLTEFVLPKASTIDLVEKIFNKDPNNFLNESRETLSRVAPRGV